MGEDLYVQPEDLRAYFAAVESFWKLCSASSPQRHERIYSAGVGLLPRAKSRADSRARELGLPSRSRNHLLSALLTSTPT